MNSSSSSPASPQTRNRWLVFTDLDACLLNEHDYSWQGARSALQFLAETNIPLVLASSKTLAEMQPLATELGIATPLICENGGAVLWPDGRCQTLGTSRDKILEVLAPLAASYRFRTFDQLQAAGIASLTGLTLEQARLANQRMATEPLQWDDALENIPAFTAAVAESGLTVTKGGRFWHVAGDNNKAEGLRQVRDWYRQRGDSDIVTVALGDSPNDIEMLKAADVAIVIPGGDGQAKIDFAHACQHVAPRTGSEGWGAAVLQVLGAAAD
ncbi:HAD-IIB family hydrolase [Roseimaritima ulvae]|uniref:Glucosyl-3-phosphoglycerate/mannosyl-3-phosphoglycerate phosphatase n=1 Tax=Roseimaritima ulvae TaxID=980254 RepID=A0A5B9QWS3_9BACT|nr:HAD-IIB family hydrolase [Roseimaritima ulvae]QEG42442.1 Glucosyl-3-phosphoglycerate/mannosyl-3-phosphoglycerate phosphatase [Roseimaritima ulvae]